MTILQSLVKLKYKGAFKIQAFIEKIFLPSLSASVICAHVKEQDLILILWIDLEKIFTEFLTKILK